MKESIISFLECPVCGGDLFVHLRSCVVGAEIKEGSLSCQRCHAGYPIVNYIPRFVQSGDYGSSFGLQFHLHSRTQLDKISRHRICHTRFFLETGFDYSLNGEKVLEVGCGAGRFTEVALDTGAEVFSVDLSNAVDVCMQNNGPHPRLNIFQADVYRMPFKRDLFDKIFCLGVVQHTPDPEKAVFAMKNHLHSGGKLAFNVYPLTFLHYLIPKYYIRSITKRMDSAKLYRLVRWVVPRMLSWVMRVRRIRIPALQSYLNLFIPDFEKLPLRRDELDDWAILVLFDMLAPKYDKPQRMKTVVRWMREAGFRSVFIHPGIVARGMK